MSEYLTRRQTYHQRFINLLINKKLAYLKLTIGEKLTLDEEVKDEEPMLNKFPYKSNLTVVFKKGGGKPDPRLNAPPNNIELKFVSLFAC